MLVVDGEVPNAPRVHTDGQQLRLLPVDEPNDIRVAVQDDVHLVDVNVAKGKRQGFEALRQRNEGLDSGPKRGRHRRFGNDFSQTRNDVAIDDTGAVLPHRATADE